jgi:2-succinyl-6-hydroxy-2,4-cyclohexadiene-1-carboxylate synthase
MNWLMLHGFTGSPASFSALSTPPTALAPILAGHLGGPRSSSSFWMEVEGLAALAPAATALFGYSLGGRLALGMLARYPQRFERAILVSAHPGLRSETERAERRQKDERFIRLLREQGLAAFVEAWEQQPLWDTQRKLPEVVRAAKRRERLAHTAQGLAQSLASVGLGQMPDLRNSLARVSCSVQLLVGALDTRFVALARELCSLMPRAQCIVADGAGHDLILERPQLCSAYLAQGVSS